MNAESMKEMGSPEEMGPGRTPRNYPAHERKRLLRLFEHSGLSAKKFCEDRGIPVSTLSYWARKSRRKASDGAVVEIPAGAMHRSTLEDHIREPGSGTVEIRLPNQVEVRILAGADTKWVTELLRGLLTCLG